ncbi:MAG TPA: hypothetical protein VFW77_03610 [Candidatus Saccharimonadales bacterium]|nr:hypothetical protein [Candidatus Saccharimonadales bacterium]
MADTVLGFQDTPEQIFGFPTEKLAEIATAARSMNPISERIGQDGRILGGLIGLFPLLEMLHENREISPQAIEAHRSDIEDIVHPLVDEFIPSSRLFKPLGAIGKVTLDTVVEKEFPHIVPLAMRKAEGYIPRATPYIDVLAGFYNPRQQFADEVNAINRMVIADMDSRAAGKPISPLSAGRSLRNILLRGLLGKPDDMTDELPALSRLMAIRNSRAGIPGSAGLSEIAALASGILQMLGSLTPESERRQDILDALKENPVPEDTHSFDGAEIDSFEQTAPLVLPMVRDLIPKTGAAVRTKFEEVKAFLS